MSLPMPDDLKRMSEESAKIVSKWYSTRSYQKRTHDALAKLLDERYLDGYQEGAYDFGDQ